jgi:hypothetical protein
VSPEISWMLNVSWMLHVGVRVHSQSQGIYRLWKKMRRRCPPISTLKITHTRGHTEASRSEQREFALNGN